MNFMDARVRVALPEDYPHIHALICELAAYERAPEAVVTTAADLLADAQSNPPWFGCWVAEAQNRLVGMALAHRAYSTWKGRSVHLEDLVVTEAWRGRGLGRALFECVVRWAKQLGAQRLAWQVLDWNRPALDFYTKLGAELDPEWVNGRLHAPALNSFPFRFGPPQQ